MKVTFAPFYYQKIVRIIESDTNIDMFDDVEVQHKNVTFRKKDSQFSLTFTCSMDTRQSTRDNIFEYYLGEIRKDLNRPDVEEKEKKDTYCWNFEAGPDNLIPYSTTMNTVTEGSYQEFIMKVKMGLATSPLIYSEASGCYEIVFDPNKENSGVQKNMRTGYQRRIFRISQEKSKFSGPKLTEKVLKFKPLVEVFTDYPKHWENIENLSYKTSIFNRV